MIQKPLQHSPAYREVVQGLLRMHQYTVDGQDQSEDADILRELMNEPWERLTAAERDRIAGLSKDLYTITDSNQSSTHEPMNPQAQHKLAEALEARERGEYDRALELLRRWGKFFPPALVAYFRARIWQVAGDPEVSVLFFEYACKLDPKNEAFQAMHLSVLKETDNPRACVIAEEVLKNSEKHIPNLVIQAADVLFGQTANTYEQDAMPVYRRLINVLTPLLSRTKDEEGFEHPSELGMIHLLLAMCHRWLGEIKEAYDYYSQALAIEPRNISIRVARGIIVYGNNPSAISDFEQAIRSGADIIWPYYFLAHYYLTNGRMEECRVMCERARSIPAPERIQSELLEFLGIARSNLGYPPQEVQRAFEEAIQMDPSNDRAKANLRRFLEGMAAKSAVQIEWHRPSDAYVRNSWQQQIRVGSFGSPQKQYACT